MRRTFIFFFFLFFSLPFWWQLVRVTSLALSSVFFPPVTDLTTTVTTPLSISMSPTFSTLPTPEPPRSSVGRLPNLESQSGFPLSTSETGALRRFPPPLFRLTSLIGRRSLETSISTTGEMTLRMKTATTKAMRSRKSDLGFRHMNFWRRPGLLRFRFMKELEERWKGEIWAEFEMRFGKKLDSKIDWIGLDWDWIWTNTKNN